MTGAEERAFLSAVLNIRFLLQKNYLRRHRSKVSTEWSRHLHLTQEMLEENLWSGSHIFFKEILWFSPVSQNQFCDITLKQAINFPIPYLKMTQINNSSVVK